MKFFIYLSPLIFLLLLAVRVIECNNLLCPYDMIHNYNYVCTGTRKGQRLERVANTIMFLFLLIIIIIHILTGMIIIIIYIQ